MDFRRRHEKSQDKKKKEEKLINTDIKIETIYGLMAIDYYAPFLELIIEQKERLNQIDADKAKLNQDIIKMKTELIKLLAIPADEVQILYKPVGMILKQFKSYEIRKSCELNILIKKRELNLLEKRRTKIVEELGKVQKEVIKLRKLFDKPSSQSTSQTSVSSNDYVN